jgi:hypothetical protein
MRRDMGRVVIERPRSGSAHKSPKIRDFGGRINADDDYDGPTRLPSSREKIYGQATGVLQKRFTDVLGPLRRYLRKNVGRPWNKVYSEACEVLRSGGRGVEHVLDVHLLSEVDRNVEMDGHGNPVSATHGYRVSGYYVHPRTGLLCLAKAVRRNRKAEPESTDRIPLGDGRYGVLINGLWFIARYEAHDGQQPGGVEDDRWPNFKAQGKLYVCRVEKSCNKAELRVIAQIRDGKKS